MARSGARAVARDGAHAVQGSSGQMGFDGRDPERDRAAPALAASTRGARRGCETELLSPLPAKAGVLPCLLCIVVSASARNRGTFREGFDGPSVRHDR